MQNKLESVRNTEFFFQNPYVVLHRFLADRKTLPDLTVRLTLQQLIDYLAFTHGQAQALRLGTSLLVGAQLAENIHRDIGLDLIVAI